MALDYAWEKLSASVSTLTEGTGTIQQRLRDAYSQFMRLQAEDLPPVLWAKYTAIDQQLTRIPAAGDEGTLMATTSVMSDEEARQIASDMFWLYDAVARLYGEEQPYEVGEGR